MAKIHERPNRASPSEAASFVEEVDRLEQGREEQLRVLDAEFKVKKRAINKKVNDDQKAILADAKKQGVNKGVIRALADGQAGIRKASEKLETAREKASDRLDGLEDEDRDYAVDIHKALGVDFASFGLGAAAVEREEPAPANGVDPIAAAAEKAWTEAAPAGAD
jgi:hypothetical protein